MKFLALLSALFLTITILGKEELQIVTIDSEEGCVPLRIETIDGCDVYTYPKRQFLTLTPSGYRFTLQSLANFLFLYNDICNLNIPNITNQDSIIIFKPSNLRGCHGQTYEVQLQPDYKPYFFIKITNREELVRLKALMNLQEFNTFNKVANSNQLLPKICLPIEVLSYKEIDTYAHIVIMPFISGITIRDMMLSLEQENLSVDSFTLSMQKIGIALANFHKKFIDENFNTIIHGDLSLDNIKVDLCGKLHLIDIDAMIRSYFNKQNPLNDLCSLISCGVEYFSKSQYALSNNFKRIFVEQLVVSYCSQYQKKQQEMLEKKLSNYLIEFFPDASFAEWFLK